MYEARISSEIGVRLCCHQLCNHAGSFSVLLQAILPSWFDRRGAIFPFLWRAPQCEAAAPSEIDVKQCSRRLCNHLCSPPGFVSSHIANVVRQAGRYLSIFMEDITTRSTSSFRSRYEAVLLPAEQPCSSLRALCQTILPTWLDRLGAIFPSL